MMDVLPTDQRTRNTLHLHKSKLNPVACDEHQYDVPVLVSDSRHKGTNASLPGVW